MAPPLYFFARRQLGDVVRDGRLLPSLLSESKLDATFDDVSSAAQCCVNEITTHGPGGASGVMVVTLPASGETPKRIGYSPDFQTWRQATKTPDGKDLWIGVDREHPPTPADLLRTGAVGSLTGELVAAHRGYTMTLADGNPWMVPVIRRHAAVASRGHRLSALPTDLGWDLEGRFVEQLKPAYQHLFDDAGALVELFYEADGQARTGEFEISVETGLAWCLRILGLNYRVGPHEQNVLHMVAESNVWLILGLAVDAPLMREIMPAAFDDAAAYPPAADDQSASTGLLTAGE